VKKICPPLLNFRVKTLCNNNHYSQCAFDVLQIQQTAAATNTLHVKGSTNLQGIVTKSIDELN